MNSNDVVSALIAAMICYGIVFVVIFVVAMWKVFKWVWT